MIIFEPFVGLNHKSRCLRQLMKSCMDSQLFCSTECSWDDNPHLGPCLAKATINAVLMVAIFCFSSGFCVQYHFSALSSKVRLKAWLFETSFLSLRASQTCSKISRCCLESPSPENLLISLAMSTERRESARLGSLARGANCSAIAFPTAAATTMGSAVGVATGGGKW